MTITCVNKNEKGEYMGRGNVLGNPFIMRGEQDRDLVCDQYRQHFNDLVSKSDPFVMGELERLINVWIETKNLKLQCFCAPSRCHTNTIKDYLVWELNNRGFAIE